MQELHASVEEDYEAEGWYPVHQNRHRRPLSESWRSLTRGCAVAGAVSLVMLAGALQMLVMQPSSFPARLRPVRPWHTRLLTTNDVKWTCSNQNGSISVPAEVPGVVHMALRDAGILGSDPLFRFNELEHSWVSLENWTYTAHFSLDPSSTRDAELLATGVLQLNSVDTVADVWLNGVWLGSTNSAFVVWRLPTKFALLAGDNVLTLHFQAPRAYAHEQAAAYPYEVPLTSYFNVWSEPSHKNFIRKPPSDFGW